MRRESIRGRRGALVAASATVVCLGAVLAACGSGGDGDGYVAVGAAGGTPGASGAVVAPTGDVSLMPLDGTAGDSGTPGGKQSAESGGADATASVPGSGSSGALPGPAADPGHSGSTSTPSSGTGGPGRPGTGSGGTSSHGPSSPATPPSGSSTTPAGPAALAVGDPRREATDQRWCEKVTVSFRNTGGTAVRSGTVTFGTHIIGALGIDWATIESSEDLPAPIAAGAKKDKTWTVCVDAWRVPLGMHIETRDVSVHWK
ncbi:hypothetical protein ABZ446_21865 [Streptomyces sp. NPDC005813]|uniref:hypothetical protein n=1 Tax=Streptomyces sp. NPDC005813 TaxID=3155592 RepID=UPI0033F0A08E